MLIPVDTIFKKGAKSPQTRENWMQPEACLICSPPVSFQIKLSWCSLRGHQISQQGTFSVAESLFFLKYINISHWKITSRRWEFIWNTGGFSYGNEELQDLLFPLFFWWCFGGRFLNLFIFHYFYLFCFHLLNVAPFPVSLLLSHHLIAPSRAIGKYC